MDSINWVCDNSSLLQGNLEIFLVGEFFSAIYFSVLNMFPKSFLGIPFGATKKRLNMLLHL